MKNIFPILSLVIVMLFSACEPQQDDAIDLPATPTNVSFTVTASTIETNVVWLNKIYVIVIFRSVSLTSSSQGTTI